MSIHPTAIIEPGAQIDEGVHIGPNAYIGPHVTIAKGTSIGLGALIEGHTTLGENCRVSAYAALGTPPQDLKYAGEPTRLEVGKNSTFREFVQINTGTESGGGLTRIGAECLIMGHTHIAHDVLIGDRCIIANFSGLAGHVELGDQVVIGAQTGIHQFVKVGAYTMIGGASAVTQDLPPFVLAEGNRAVLRGLNLVGLRRHLSREAIDALKPVFKQLFRSGQSPKEAATALLEKTTTPEVKTLCEFVIASKRGIPIRQEKVV